MEIRDLFVEYFKDEPLDLTSYENDCIALLVGEGYDRGLNFHREYGAEKRTDSETAPFDEDYFDEPERKKLYVYLCAKHSPEIWTHLQDIYRTANLKVPTLEDLDREIEHLTSRGVKL